MKTPEQIQSDLNYLASEIRKGRVVLFVGAGLSRNAVPKSGKSARMLGWDELKARFASELGWDQRRTDSVSAPRLIQMYEGKFGRDRRNQILREAIPNDDVEPGKIHSLVIDFDWHAIVTTNIDTMIEQAYGIAGREHSPVIFEEDLAKITANPIYKFHGSIEAQRTWIFSEREYNQEVQPLFVDKLRSIFAEKTVLFLGYGVNDPDLDSILYFIQKRIGHYQKKAFLLFKEDGDVNRFYWRDRNIELITNRDLEALNTLDSQSNEGNAASSEDHATFLFSFLKFLKDAINRNPRSADRRSRWLWRETRLKPAVSHSAGNAYEIVRSFLAKDLIPRGRQQDVITRLHENALKPEWRKNVAEVCEAVNRLLAVRSKDDFHLLSTEMDELIFGLDLDSPDYGMLALLPMGIAVASIDPSLYEQTKSTVQHLIEAAWNRLYVGHLHGLPDYKLNEVLILTLRLRRNGSRSGATPFPAALWYDLFVLRHISGGGISEEKLYQRLSRIVKADRLTPQKKAFVEFRRAVACIYVNRWQEIEALLERVDGIIEWRAEWTAFLLFELGDYEKSEKIYSQRAERGETRKIRYVAAQAQSIAIRAGRYWNYFYSREEFKLRQSSLENLARIEAEASSAGEYIGDFDFLGDQSDNLHRRLLDRAFKDLQKVADSNRLQRFDFSTSNPLYYLHDELLRWALNGVPLAPLRTDDMREKLSVLLASPGLLSAMIELQGMLPVFEDFGKEHISSKMALLAWKRAETWVRIQRDILDQYDRLIDFILRSRFLSRDSDSPVLKRFISLSGLIGYGSFFFSKSSLNRLKDLMIIVLDDVKQFSPPGEATGIAALRYTFSAFFSRAESGERASFLARIPPTFFFDYAGQEFLEYVEHQIDSSIWDLLPPEYCEEILKLLKERLPASPYDCFNLLFFVRGMKEESHPILDEFEAGMDAYRSKELDRLQAIVQQADQAGDNPAAEDYLRLHQKAYESLKVSDNDTFRHYREILDSIRPDVGGEPIEDLSVWIQRKQKELEKGGISSVFNGLHQFIRQGIPVEDRPMVEDLLITVLDRIRPRLPAKDGFDRLAFSPICASIGNYYLVTEQFDRWLRLWEELGTFYGYSVNISQIKKMRETEELAGDAVSFSERLGYIFLRCPEQKRRGILHFLHNVHNSMTRVLPSDLRLLRFLWAEPSIRSKTIELPLHLMDRILAIDAGVLSDDLPSFLFQLVHSDDLEILPVRAESIQAILEKTKSAWQSNPQLKARAEAILENINLLDFPESPKQ